MSNFVNELRSQFGTEINALDVKVFARGKNVNYRTVTRRLEQYKVKRGTWKLTSSELKQARQVLEKTVSTQMPTEDKQCFIPEKDSNYVPFGNFTDLKKVVKSKEFYPIFITGLSGNGKTVSVEQACAQSNRELIRVNITIETDEDDLIGGFRLVNGETVWHNGPVIEALSRGAVLLLDEVDLASNKIFVCNLFLKAKVSS